MTDPYGNTQENGYGTEINHAVQTPKLEDSTGYTFPCPLKVINQEFELLRIKCVAEEFIDMVEADEAFVQQLMDELPDINKIPEFYYDTESTYGVNNLLWIAGILSKLIRNRGI